MGDQVVIIGAGIVGVATGIWLRRFDVPVTILDRGLPGQGTSFGNAGVLAACAMVPVTTPGLLRKAPGMVVNPDFPLFLRWGYLPRLLPWLMKYMSHANDAETRRIAAALTPIVSDSVAQHHALADGTRAAPWVQDSDYSFAYTSRAAFEAEHYTWALREEAGFVPTLRDGAEMRAYEPALGPEIRFLATMSDHGYIRDPGGYVAALAQEFLSLGGVIRQTEVQDVEFSDTRVSAVLTGDGRIACDRLVIATGVWSTPLMKKLGIRVPLESERGYHIVFERASGGPHSPVMVAHGKFAATPMDAGLRCAGVLEFGGLDAGPSRAPFELLRRHVLQTFPDLQFQEEVEWMGHRPSPSDSLPLIGEIGQTGAFAAFGHQHIGLTAGPKTGRLVAGLVAGRPANLDLRAYAPGRFA
ncbi:NAD(P)/FAD-dependent oxidoreductase [Oceanibium sediminis]|uniref:NAD(P)/FAD-dependent oxidoreductase n=1 Tax=Oceanibium sediminis TaxID=2026339 RepID=UPI000DD400C9|nr:FAD-binding oxidoreductase [Oceanibium sediminis]